MNECASERTNERMSEWFDLWVICLFKLINQSINPIGCIFSYSSSLSYWWSKKMVLTLKTEKCNINPRFGQPAILVVWHILENRTHQSTHCWINAGTASQRLAQHWSSNGGHPLGHRVTPENTRRWTKCWVDVGPSSTTLAQHQPRIGWTSRGRRFTAWYHCSGIKTAPRMPHCPGCPRLVKDPARHNNPLRTIRPF